MRRRQPDPDGQPVAGQADADRWIIIGHGEDPAAAKAAVYEWLAARGLSSTPRPDGGSVGMLSFRNEDIRVDVVCGRDAAPSSTRISIRASALERQWR
jgi:hypothetical protein